MRLGLFFILVSILSLHAQDNYHQTLFKQLEDQYGIVNGECMISDTEKTTNSKLSLSKVSGKTISWEGDEPFTQVLELKTTSRQEEGYDAAVRFACQQEVYKGDVLLAVLWINSVESDVDVNHVTFKFEPVGGPWNSETQPLILGSDIKTGWHRWLIPIESKVDYVGEGIGRFQIDMGMMKGIIQVAGVAVINFRDRYEKDELPFSVHHLDYQGRESDALWRRQALQRIDRIRKGELDIKVINTNGHPIKNARVNVNMQQHEFGFGSAISTHWWLTRNNDSDMYLTKLENLTGDGRSFSVVVFENATKWPSWENPHTRGTPDQIAEITDWLKSAGMRVRGHNLVWPQWNHLPDDLEKNKDHPDYIKSRIQDHIAEEAGYDGLKGQINEWDVINEMVHCTDLADIFGTENIYTDWLNWAHASDPRAKLYINEYSIISGGQDSASQTKYKEIIRNILDQDAPLHGIGMQGHVGNNLTPPERILTILDDFAQFDLDISITEYDTRDTPDDLAADYMRDILITAFSHPQVVNFLMWGFWDGSHWHKDAPLFRKDWSLKPAGQVFIDWVFNTWWTEESGYTNREGEWQASAFYGLYEISASFEGKEVKAQKQFCKENQSITLQIDTENTGVESGGLVPLQFELCGNYPNPFNPNTVIRYTLPRANSVNINIFDITGRLVDSLVNEQQTAGRHQVTFFARDLPSGIYTVHIIADQHQAKHKMALLR